jgi:integrase
MAGERGRLTDLQIRHWIKAGEPLAKADGGGLTFTLSAGGAAGWVLRYSHGGRRRELTIGRYPDIGLADARGIATIKRAEIMQGRNPAADKQKAKATAAKDWTVRELAKDYRAKKLVSLAHSTQVSDGRHLKRLEKNLGALTVREIEASDVVALIEASGLTWGESNMLLITTKCLFMHACGKRLINVNPCHGIMLSALLGERPPKRQRLMLTRDEIQLLLSAELRRRNALALRIRLATAVRSAEIYQAKWADVHAASGAAATPGGQPWCVTFC